MKPFVHADPRCRVVFGFGTRDRVPEELEALGAGRPLVVVTPQQAAQAQALARRIGPECARVFAEAAMHTPTDVTARGMEALRDHRADAVVSLGGGSAVGLGKALSVRSGAPHLAVPTTYAGSEATPILGETQDGVKTTRRADVILPRVIVYDVELTLTLPAALSATSGLNAIAHAAEALYARDASPLTMLMAESSIASLAAALPAIVADPGEREARAQALYGSWLAGACLGMVGMALHHKLCHVLGGMFDLPHAETHAVLLPHVMAYNAASSPDAMARIARGLGAADAVAGLSALNVRLGVPPSLAAVGMPAAGIGPAAAAGAADPYWNPRRVDEESLRALLAAAYAGAVPGAAHGSGGRVQAA